MADQKRAWREALEGKVDPGEVIAGKYRLDRIVGIGGMGVVVEAWHLDLEERVAVKFLMPHRAVKEKTRERFRREARAGFRITSEHVARVFDLGTLDNGLQYMAMEYLAGQSLAQLLTVHGPVRPSTAVGYVLQACEAVAEAHALGYVHRDLKPDNLFLCKRADGSPCVKVLDFGLAKDAALPHHITRVNRGMGTPRYMSPEQWVSARDVGPASDIWAFAVVLFELISGVVPFDSMDLTELSQLVIFGDAPRLSEVAPDAHVPAELDAVLQTCFHKKAAQRYPDVPSLAAALLPFAPQLADGSLAGTQRSVPPVSSWALTFSELDGDVTRPEEQTHEVLELDAEDLASAGTTDEPLRVDVPEGASAHPWRRLALVALAVGIGGGAAVLLHPGREDVEPAGPEVESPSPVDTPREAMEAAPAETIPGPPPGEGGAIAAEPDDSPEPTASSGADPSAEPLRAYPRGRRRALKPSPE